MANPEFSLFDSFLLYLNQKIKELKQGLSNVTTDELIVSGKIYGKQQNTYKEIYPDLVCMDYSNFN